MSLLINSYFMDQTKLNANKFLVHSCLKVVLVFISIEVLLIETMPC